MHRERQREKEQSSYKNYHEKNGRAEERERKTRAIWFRIEPVNAGYMIEMPSAR